MDNLQIIRVKELCSLLKISVPTLYRWHANGDIPLNKIKYGKNIVGYRRADVEEWLNERAESETE